MHNAHALNRALTRSTSNIIIIHKEVILNSGPFFYEQIVKALYHVPLTTTGRLKVILHEFLLSVRLT